MNKIEEFAKKCMGETYYCLGCAIKDYCRTYNVANYYPEAAPCEEVWKAWAAWFLGGELNDENKYRKYGG